MLDSEAVGETNQPSTPTNDSTTWNRSGYTATILSKPRSKLLRTPRGPVGKFPLQYDYTCKFHGIAGNFSQ